MIEGKEENLQIANAWYETAYLIWHEEFCRRAGELREVWTEVEDWPEWITSNCAMKQLVEVSKSPPDVIHCTFQSSVSFIVLCLPLELLPLPSSPLEYQ